MQSHGESQLVAELPQSLKNQQRTERLKWSRAMSALGQKQTLAVQNAMSALPPIADIPGGDQHVCFVPIADISANLFCQLQRGHRLCAVAPQIKLPIERVEFRQLSD
jgi:hypothetical protein